MRVPLSWLRELVDVDVHTEELAVRLSMTGTAVDAIHRLEPKVSGVVAAAVLDVSDVPESEKLCLAHVDAGSHGRFQVVAGAKNFRAGDVVPFATPGTRIGETTIGVRTMAKLYESQGMVCSADELGIAVERFPWIVTLPPDTVPGTDVVRLLGLDDEVLSFEIYPNRPDLMSVVGIAREVALLYGLPLRTPDASVLEEGPDAASSTSVTIEDRRGCPRYLARVVDEVSFHPSPALAQARLSACGFRPLGNLVDATNYVLLLTGHPLHAFDLDRLAEERIVVRRARAGERLQTLDGTDRSLDPGDLVIADGRDAQALAGIMGGTASEVGPSTRRVLLESAYFTPVVIAGAARRHRMRTEASARFERGADPEAVPAAAAMCAELLRRWAGGRVARGVADEGSAPPRRTVRLRRPRAEAVLGLRVPDDEADAHLRGLGCEVSLDVTDVVVVVPSWRPDLEREIDLVEELARLHGYDRFPLRMPRGQRGFLSREQRYRRRLRGVLLGAGLSEATLLSFVSDDDLALVGDPPVLRVTNPMSAEQGQMRPSLVPGLLRAAARNAAQSVSDTRLFEMGRVFVGWQERDELPSEELRVGAVLAGHADGGWHAKPRPVDAFDAKGIVELVMDELGVDDWGLGPCHEPPFHPGRSATVLVGGDAVGRFGEVRPSVASALDLQGGVALLELRADALIDRAPAKLTVRELPRFPAVTRDLAVEVEEDVPAGAVASTIRDAVGALVESVRLFDVYRGPPVPEGRKSLAFRLVLRAPDRTLTSAEADTARASAVEAARERHGAHIR